MNVEWMDLENPDNQWNLVAFRLEQQTYALPIEPIAQIIEMVTITPIPQVSNTVEGVINVRGAPVPVVNLRRHLGLSEYTLQLHTPIVLTQVGELMVGLIVDEVLDVLSLPGGQITHPADILPEGLGKAPVLRGLTHTSDGMMLLLDLDYLFLPHQAQALAQAMKTLPQAIVKEGQEESRAGTQEALDRLDLPPAEPEVEAVVKEAHARIPTAAYDIPVAKMGLSTRVLGYLERGGVENVGQVMEHLAEGDKGLLKLNGIGPKSLAKVREALSRLDLSSV